MSINDYPAKLTSGYYRVRASWEDEASEVGKYRLLERATAMADDNPGTFVFSPDGEAIYPEGEASTPAEEPTENLAADSANGPAIEAEVSEPTLIEYFSSGWGVLEHTMNIRKEPSIDSELITRYRRGTIVEVVERLESGWLKIVCDEAEDGIGYVTNKRGTYVSECEAPQTK